MESSSDGSLSRERAPIRLPPGLIFRPGVQRGVLAIALSCIISFLMLDYARVPGFDLKEGDVSEHDVRAAQSFDVVDQEATRARRDQAERTVRPIFDMDTGVVVGVTSRLRQAFSEMREALAELPRQQAAPSPDAIAGSAPSDPEGSVREPSVGARPPEMPAADLQRRFAQALGIEVLDVFYQNLLYLGFDPAIENAVSHVVSAVLAEPVIADSALLPADLAANGILIAELGGAQRSERLEFEPDRILDLEMARRRTVELTASTFAERPQFHRDTIAALASALLRANLSYNAAQTTVRRMQLRNTVQPVSYQIKRGTIIVRAGDPIDAQKLLILQSISKAGADYRPWQMFLSVSALVFIILGVSYLFATAYIRKFANSMRDLVTVSLILAFSVALTRVSAEVSSALGSTVSSIPLSAYYLGIPIACGAMVVRILMNSETALLFAMVISALAAMLLEYNSTYMLFFFLSSLAAAGGISHTRERVHVLQGGLVAALCNVAMVVALYTIQSNTLESRVSPGNDHLLFGAAFAFLGGIMSAIIALGVIPFFEMFGYVTDYKLLELANLNHPLLKELMLKAPGTYHHSVIVGQLSEAASQSVGANALLARVGCYYHDIGKMRKPEYFIENLRSVSENRHDHIPAQMSALIIASHVREGIEMGRQHRLPQAIIDLIPGHHGTALISFFYNKAKQEAGPDELIDENDFRYPGPRPRTREAGIVMLADATEASTRSIKNVNPAKIRMNLQKIFQRVVNDGQLDECPLTLRDLSVVRESFHRTLQGIYHNRIEYPPEVRDGAAMAGIGTGAVVSLPSDLTVELLPNLEDRSATSPASAAQRRARLEDLSATTTIDPLPFPRQTTGEHPTIEPREDLANPTPETTPTN